MRDDSDTSLARHGAPDISVVVPIYNEEDSVAPLHAAIVAALEPMGRSFEILFVDDGSKDASIPRAVALAEADLRLSTKLAEGYDLVVGWRMNRQDKFLSRKLPSKLANKLIGKVTGLPIRDNGCSLKVYRADVIQKVPLYSDMHRIIPAMTIPVGGRIAEVGVHHHAPRVGESKLGLSRIFKVLLDLLVVKTLLHFARRPLASFVNLALLMGLAALASALFIGPGTRGSEVVAMTVAGLLAAGAIFLSLCGVVTMLAFRDKAVLEGTADVSVAGPGWPAWSNPKE